MNPFDWAGPQFLVFFTILGIIAVGMVEWHQYNTEAGDDDASGLVGPYRLAYLRGGAKAAAEVAVIALLQQRLINADEDEWLRRSLEANPDDVANPLERALLRRLNGKIRPAELVEGMETLGECDEYHDWLISRGLLPDQPTLRRRLLSSAIALGVLIAVGGWKLILAYSRHRSNVLFLIILMIVFGVLVVRPFSRRLTWRGRRALAAAEGLCGDLRLRASRFDDTFEAREVLLLAGMFGPALLPARVFPYSARIFGPPPGKIEGGTDSGSSGSGSCGSSGGCGGGGCGGGCGGCGS